MQYLPHCKHISKYETAKIKDNALSPVALPEGCKVYQAEQWMYTR